MRQAIHIFGKDARHCWPYVAAVMALTAVHAWRESVATPDLGVYPRSLYGSLLSFLMVLTWWFAIGAAVHGESPVGDSQFWITRPYSWRSLLAAKFLFVAAFLLLPLFISDCAILLASGFSPVDLIPGLLERQCWCLAFLVLPFVLAALTRMTREFVLAGLAFYVASYFALFAFAASAGRLGLTYSAGPSWSEVLAPWLIAATGLFLAAWQYARRRTIRIRVLAIALGGLSPFAIATALAPTDLSTPRSGHDDPRCRKVKVEVAAETESASPLYVDPQTKSEMGFSVKISGWPADLFALQPVSVNVTAPETGSTLWSTSIEGMAFRPATSNDGRKSAWFLIDVPKTPSLQKVDLWVSFSLKFYERQGSAEIPEDGGWARVPGFGNVRSVDDVGGSRLVWRTALAPGERDWTYGLGNGRSEYFTDAGWLGTGNATPASPFFFPLSPVYSYAGVTGVPASRARPTVLTIKRTVGTRTYNNLKVLNVQLTGFATTDH